MSINIPKQILSFFLRTISTTKGYPLVIECYECNNNTINEDLTTCPKCGATDVDRYRIETYID